MPRDDDIQFSVDLALRNFLGSYNTLTRSIQNIGKVSKGAEKDVNALGMSIRDMGKGGSRFIDQGFGKRMITSIEVLNRALQQSRTNMSLFGNVTDTVSRKIFRSMQALVVARNRATAANKKATEALDESRREGTDATEAVNRAIEADINLTKAEDDLKAALSERAAAQAKAAKESQLSTRLVAGFGQVQGAIKTVVGVLGKFTTALGIAGIASFAFNKTLGLIRGALRLLFSPITRAIDSFRRLFRTAAAVAFGVLIRDTIRNIIRNIRDLITAAGDAVKMFQNLQLRLESFENRLLRLVDPTLDFESAMGQAQERAAGLIELIKQLSLTIPFSTEVIGNTLSLNLAMGFTERQAISLTESIAAFTAGMGLSSEIMERIVFNLGQMKAAGKVTATELRDLARGAFFPINEILEEAARLEGVAAEGMLEFKEAAAEGRISVQTFFQAFENVVARDFPDALERFSNTIEGVRIRFGNFMKTIVGLEILGPIAKRVTKLASSALDRLLTPSVQRAARALGESLARAFDDVVQAIRIAFIPALRDLAKQFGITELTIEGVIRFIAVRIVAVAYLIRNTIIKISAWLRSFSDDQIDTFRSAAQSAFGWGANIILSLARGMVSAATYVVRAIVSIVNVIAGLLGPGSPPKALPKLPEWGMAAMTEFLKGFLLADFDVLKGIQDPVKDALDILEQTGKIAENSAGRIYASISKAIAEALSSGRITEELFSKIRKATGPFGEEIATLARRQVELAASTRAVQEAEERLERARKAHEASRVKTNKLIREYNASLRAGADPAYLRTKLAEINASEKASQAAYQEQKAAEADLETKEGLLKIIKEQTQLQEELVRQLIELTKAQIVMPTAEEAGGAGEGAEITEPEAPPTFEDVFGELPGIDTAGLETDIQSILDEAKALAEQWALDIQAAFDSIGFGGLLEELGKLGTAFENLGVAWKEGGVREGILFDLFLLQTSFDVFKEHVKSAFGESSLSGLSFASVISFALGLISVAIVGAEAYIVGLIGGLLGWWETFSEGIHEMWEGIKLTWEGIKDSFQGAWDYIKGIFLLLSGDKEGTKYIDKAFEEMAAGIGETLAGLYLTVEGFFKSFLKAPLDFLREFKDKAIGFLDEMKQRIVGNSIIPEMMSDIETTIGDAMGRIIADWEEKWKAITDWLSVTFGDAVDDALGFMQDIVDEVKGALGNALIWLKDNVMTPLATGIGAAADALSRFYTWVKNVADAILHVDLVRLAALIGLSPSPLSIGIDYATEAMQRMAREGIPQLQRGLEGLGASYMVSQVAAQPVAGVSNSVSVNMGGVNISNGMDEAMFEARVLNIMQKGLRK